MIKAPMDVQNLWALLFLNRIKLASAVHFRIQTQGLKLRNLRSEHLRTHSVSCGDDCEIIPGCYTRVMIRNMVYWIKKSRKDNIIE